MQIDQPHYKVLALAPFHFDPARKWEDLPLPVDRYTLDEAMARLQVRLFLPLDAPLCPAGGFDLCLENLKAMHPDGVIKASPYLTHLVQARSFIQTARSQGSNAEQIRQGLAQWPDLPPITIKEDTPRSRAQQTESRLDNILDMVAMPDDEPQPAVRSRAETDQVDVLLADIMETLFGHPVFKTVEGAWRGLRLLLQQGASGSAVSVAMAPVHAENLAQTLEALTPHVINDLPNVILLDLPFDNSPLSMERLSAAAEWAATLMVPLVAWIPANFFQIPAWRDLATLPFLPHHLETPPYAKFGHLRASDEGQWLCLTCNRFLIRFPYGKENPPRQVAFNESRPLWISPVWALGTLIAQCAEQTGWPTRFNDIQRFQIQDLALHPPGGTPPMVSEANFTRDRLDQFTRAGITPLATEMGRDKAFMPKAVTCSGGALAFQLLLSHTTRFILWCKDHLPAESGPDDLQRRLQQALEQFSNQSRPPGFTQVQVVTAAPGDQGGIPVHFALTPNPAVLSSQQVIELRMDW